MDSYSPQLQSTNKLDLVTAFKTVYQSSLLLNRYEIGNRCLYYSQPMNQVYTKRVTYSYEYSKLHDKWKQFHILHPLHVKKCTAYIDNMHLMSIGSTIVAGSNICGLQILLSVSTSSIVPKIRQKFASYISQYSGFSLMGESDQLHDYHSLSGLLGV